MSVRWSRLLSILAATFLVATSLAAQPASGWKATWDKTVATANKEGALTISGPSGTAWREQLLTFQKAYPAIKVDITATASRDFWPRIIKEREAGLHLWDFRIGGPDNQSYSVKAMGAMTPVRDMLILPEVLDDNAWLGGLDGIFLDKEKKYFLGFAIYEEGFGTYNDKLIPGGIGGMKNLNDPKWTGKVSIADPRAGSSLVGSGVMAVDYAHFDEYIGGQTEAQQPYQKRASEIYRELLK
jgi:hypothetical protein